MGFFDLFKPRWQHSDYRVRVEGLKACKDPAILAKIALRDESGDVRLTALSKLEDQMVIAQIACSDPKHNNRMYALERLHDRGTLVQVMNDQRGPLDVRLAAAVKVGDTASTQILCAQLALSFDAPTGAPNLVRDILTDETSLILVATCAKISNIRAAAARKVCNQNALRAIAVNDPDDTVRGVAVANITDQNILCDVLLSVSPLDWEVRRAAPEKLTDQALIAKLIENIIEQGEVVLADILIRKCTDKGVLERCVRSNNAGVRAAAVVQIDNPMLLAEIARTDPEFGVRVAAVAQVDNQALVAEIAIADESFFVRQTATKNLADPAFSSLTDQEMLTGLATQSNDLQVRARAVERLTNQSALAQVARNGPDRTLRVDAVNRMTDQILLAVIANSGPAGGEEGVRKLIESPGRDDLYTTTEVEFVPDARETARKRLAELERKGT